MLHRRFAVLVSRWFVPALLATFFATPSAKADSSSALDDRLHGSALHADMEVDPTAYALKGFSLHVGVSRRNLRLDLGNFAMALPRFAHGDDGFDVSFDGYGAKLQWFLFDEQAGLFAGVDAGLVRVQARRQNTDLSVRQNQFGLGVHAGYRFTLPAGFYLTPWLGVGYQFNTSDITLADATYKTNPISLFPAVHLGFRFR